MILHSRQDGAAVLAAKPGTYVSRYQPKDQEAAMPDRHLRIVSTSETANRAAVALDIADAVARLPWGRDPDVVRQLPDKGWADLADLAGQPAGYVPSAETRQTVVRILERRKREASADPFRGFPS